MVDEVGELVVALGVQGMTTVGQSFAEFAGWGCIRTARTRFVR